MCVCFQLIASKSANFDYISQGPRSKFSSWGGGPGAKEECVKEIFFGGGGGGGMLVDFYSISLK